MLHTLQPLQRFVDLPGGGLPGPAIDLRHEEDFLAIAVTQRPPHADFAGAAIIIPAVVHEGESLIDGAPDNRYCSPLRQPVCRCDTHPGRWPRLSLQSAPERAGAFLP